MGDVTKDELKRRAFEGVKGSPIVGLPMQQESSRFATLYDEARKAIRQKDPLRGSELARSVQETVLLLTLADGAL